MLAPTHSVFGVFLTLIILGVFGIPSSLHWTVLLCAVIGSLAPDLDTEKSLVGKLCPFISGPIEGKFGHRSVTHSIIGWVIASVAFSLTLAFLLFLYRQEFPQLKSLIYQTPAQTHPFNLWSGDYFRMISAFSFGYISHLILDMFNPRGVQLLWPDITRDVIPKNPAFRPRSGSKTEIFIFIGLLVLLGAALPLSKYGALTSLRWFLGTPESAISEFKTAKEKALVSFQGIHTDTKTPIQGQAEVLDVQNKKLIVLYKGLVFTISDELTADILAKKVHLIKTTTPIQTDHIVFKDKTQYELIATLTDTGLVSGTIQLPKDLKINFEDVPKGLTTQSYLASSFKTMDQVGDTLILHFATKAQLSALKLNDSFYLLQKQRAQNLTKLQRERRQIQVQLQQLNAPNGLTPLGESVLISQEDRTKKAQKQEEFQGKLEEMAIQIEALQAEQKSDRLLFSGDVTIRSSFAKDSADKQSRRD